MGRKKKRIVGALNADQKASLMAGLYVLAMIGVIIFLFAVSGCASQTVTDSKVRALYCLGFCAQAEVEHESDVETEETNREDIEHERRTGNE